MPAADEPTGADGLTIAVSDTGCGIRPDDLPRVTGKFCKADRKKLGSGLVLSIVDEIVRLYCGRISITSEMGRGTTATVWLPAVSPGREPPAGRTTG
ncbi:MAG TPA: ATP-binding protein [Bacillota bacterium]